MSMLVERLGRPPDRSTKHARRCRGLGGPVGMSRLFTELIWARPLLRVISLDNRKKDSHNFPEVATSKEKYAECDPLNDEITSFVNAVKNRSEPVVTGEDGRNALSVALNIIDQIEK